MQKVTSKLAAVISCAVVVLYAATPALAVSTLNLSESGNGAGSANSINVTNTQTHTIDQSNSFTGTTTVTASPNSGGNTITNQTGGDTAIGTGNASATVDILTQANVNQVQDNRLSSDPSKTLSITGNGALSSSEITTDNTTSDSVFQDNIASVTNAVTADPNTGNNAITNGTGGSQTIVTGHAVADVGIQTQANVNTATLGSNGNGTGGDTAASISGNGAGSANAIDLTQNRILTFVQNNDTAITNAVTANPNTGFNTATNNTGPVSGSGGFRLDTGNASSSVAVTNNAGVNIASNGSGYNSSATASESGNGAFSSNDIFSTLNDSLSLFQGAGEGSRFTATTAVTADPFSGVNTALNDTFASGDTGVLVTGHAMSDTFVANQGNVNLFGPSSTIALPGGTTLGFSFNLGGLFGIL